MCTERCAQSAVIIEADEVTGRVERIPGDMQPAAGGQQLVGVFGRKGARPLCALFRAGWGLKSHRAWHRVTRELLFDLWGLNCLL